MASTRIPSRLNKFNSCLSPRNVMKLGPANYKSLVKLWKNNEYQKTIKALFGNFSLRDIVHKSYLTIGVPDSEENIVGVMVLEVYPNLPVICPGDWESWIMNMYGLKQVNSYNSLWIKLLVWHPIYYCLFMKPMVQYLFTTIAELKHLLMIIPPIDDSLDFLDGTGYKIQPIGDREKFQSIYFILREHYVPMYKVRGAVEEDNDNIVELIEAHTDRLSETYDKYFVAEILTRFKDMGRKIIVAEKEEKVVGVLILNDYVNYRLLLTEFEIGPYNGLKKPHYQDMENFVIDEVVRFSPSMDLLFLTKDIEDLYDLLHKKSDVADVTEEHEVVFNITRTDSDDYSLVLTSSALYLFHDDDEVENTDAVAAQNSQETLETDLYEKLAAKKRRNTSILTNVQKGSGFQIDSKGRAHNPEFLGEPNAFTLEVVAIDPDNPDCLETLLGAAYDCFPDKEYCVMSLPSSEEEGPLKNYLTFVPPRLDGDFPENLYVMHRNAILSNVHVTEIAPKHRAQVKNLLSTIPNSISLWYQLDYVIQNNSAPAYCYVMLCEETVIGVALLLEEFDFVYLRNHYDLYPLNIKCYRSGSIGLVENIVVSPIFHRFAKFLVRELHRHSEFDVLFYKLKPSENSAVYRERPLNTLLDIFLPMMPLKVPEMDLESLKKEGYEVNGASLEEREIFALYLSTIATCSMKIFKIKKKIVVVGNSTTALSFIKSLLFCKNLHYNVRYTNITLITNQSFYPGKISKKIRESFVVKKHFFYGRLLDAMNLRTFVNSFTANITEIRRKEKIIVMNNEFYLPYDLLFLMAGEIFLKPQKIGSIPFPYRPLNLYMINNLLDAFSSLTKLKSLIVSSELRKFKIIVYGHYLQAYVTLGGLLSLGIPGRQIIFIEPFPFTPIIGKPHKQNISIFNDPDIEEAVYTTILREGVEMYSSFYFTDFEYDAYENLITTVRFESRHKMLKTECLALFYFGERDVQPTVVTVLQKAGLVYDGRLVIDKNYQTNDPNIYAAGTLTKYSRKYYANQFGHKYFNRSEVGKHLAENIKRMLLPKEFQETEIKPLGWNFYVENNENLVPKYERPIMRYCKLPGELYYFSVVRPGRRIPLQTAIGLENYIGAQVVIVHGQDNKSKSVPMGKANTTTGTSTNRGPKNAQNVDDWAVWIIGSGQVFITGNTRHLDEQGYFRLHINQNDCVETITCLSKSPVDIHNLYSLWGKNEKMLNHLTTRFHMILIKDFFQFFREPWAMLLYHSKFQDLMDYCNMVTTSILGHEGESIVNKLMNKMKENKWKPLTEAEYEKLANDFKILNYKSIIEHRVMEFIEENIDQLAVYAHPKIIISLLKGYENSPLFH